MNARVIAWCVVFVVVGTLYHYRNAIFVNPFAGLDKVNPVARQLPHLPEGCKSVEDCL